MSRTKNISVENKSAVGKRKHSYTHKLKTIKKYENLNLKICILKFAFVYT